MSNPQEHPYAEVLRWVIAGKRIEVSRGPRGWHSVTDKEIFSMLTKYWFEPSDFRLAEGEQDGM